MKPRDPIKGDAYSLPPDIPRDLMRALELFSESAELEALLGKDFCCLYSAIKQQESEAFLQVISPWEREHLLLNV